MCGTAGRSVRQDAKAQQATVQARADIVLNACFRLVKLGTMHWPCAGNKAAEELDSILSRLLSYGDVRLPSLASQVQMLYLHGLMIFDQAVLDDVPSSTLNAGVAAVA
jgi:hypothetical protein